MRKYVVLIIVVLAGFCVHAQHKPEKYRYAIAQFAKIDSLIVPEEGGILFLGSSSFTKWQDVKDYFPGKEIINRGFGGSEMSDILFYREQLILPYKPQKIVVFVGGNDINAGDSPQKVFREGQKLVKWTHKYYPDVRFLFLSMKPSPRRWDLCEKLMKLNRKLEKRANRDKIDYIDIWNPMLGDTGKPLPGLFLEDQLHLNEEGYKIWQKCIAPYLE
nr:GDSL-type esterase/lipase family protein [uncultured Draconibacterium sp.]